MRVMETHLLQSPQCRLCSVEKYQRYKSDNKSDNGLGSFYNPIGPVEQRNNLLLLCYCCKLQLCNITVSLAQALNLHDLTDLSLCSIITNNGFIPMSPIYTSITTLYNRPTMQSSLLCVKQGAQLLDTWVPLVSHQMGNSGMCNLLGNTLCTCMMNLYKQVSC